MTAYTWEVYIPSSRKIEGIF